MADGDAAINWPGGHSPRFLIASGFSREDDLSVGDRVRERTARSGVELDFKSQGGLTGAAPAGLVSGLQQALLSLIANVTQQMQICSRPCSLSAPLRGPVVDLILMRKVEIIIKDTHRGLWYEDGVLTKVVEAGRYEIPNRESMFGRKGPLVELVLVDIRERDLTIKGQEILTSDKVALRVSIIVQFRVVDPKLAIHAVEKYEDRLYSDVQLAARRSLASMTLEDILTNRNRLSEDILSDVKSTAASYGVTIQRADVKDLAFPGNLQEIMNKVLAAERMSQVQLVEARTKANVQKIESQAMAEAQRMDAEARANAQRLAAEGDAQVQRMKTEAEIRQLQERERTAKAYANHPALLRMLELETLRELGRNGNARIYIGFEKHAEPDATKGNGE
jgi:regulator of protease activity HflC (stomatin/prohibitin superfamily)